MGRDVPSGFLEDGVQPRPVVSEFWGQNPVRSKFWRTGHFLFQSDEFPFSSVYTGARITVPFKSRPVLSRYTLTG